MKLIIISFFFVPILIFGQDDVKNSRLKYGFHLTPEWNRLHFSKSIENSTSKTKLGGSFGFVLEVALNKKLSLRTGVGLGLKRYEEHKSKLIFPTDIDPVLGYISESSMIRKLDHLEVGIPALFQYHFGSVYYLNAGTEIIIPVSVVKYYQEIRLGNGEILTSTSPIGLNRTELNFAPLISLGYKIKLKKGRTFMPELLFKYYLKEHLLPETNLFSIALKLGFNF